MADDLAMKVIGTIENVTITDNNGNSMRLIGKATVSIGDTLEQRLYAKQQEKESAMKQKRDSLNGNCFQVAAELALIEAALCRNNPYKTVTLVHGVVTGRFACGEVQHVHAWVELKDADAGITWVLDKSNGHDVKMPRDIYYVLGKIEDTRTYSAVETSKWLLKNKTFGPWSAMLNDVQTEAIEKLKKYAQKHKSAKPRKPLDSK